MRQERFVSILNWAAIFPADVDSPRVRDKLISVKNKRISSWQSRKLQHKRAGAAHGGSRVETGAGGFIEGKQGGRADEAIGQANCTIRVPQQGIGVDLI